MINQPELHRVCKRAAVWQRYDPALKAELWSSAIQTNSGVYLIDPIALDRQSLAQLFGDTAVAAVVVTNENHIRDAISFGVPIFARFPVPDTNVRACESLPPDFAVIDVPGAPAGEIALVSATGELVIGDALINFEPYGFAFLPDKYCRDPRQMRQSLSQLLCRKFARILFAHGTPITSNAHERLGSLLASADCAT